MTEPTLRILSLGAGRQSTTLLLLAAEGRIGPLDAAIFADTGWEPDAVYRHLDRIEREVAQPAGIPVYRVSVGNIREDALNPEHHFASMPLHILGEPRQVRDILASHPCTCAWAGRREGDLSPDPADCPRCENRGQIVDVWGKPRIERTEGLARRQCTNEYKIVPIKRKVRELLGYPGSTPIPRGVFVEQWIGISRDEIERVKDSDVRYARNTFPLLDLPGSADGGAGWTVTDCQRYLRTRGYGNTPKSACKGCPFHGDALWRALRDTCTCGHPRSEHRFRLTVGANACWHWDPLVIPGEPEPVAEHCTCTEFSNPEWLDVVEFDHAIRGGSARANATGNQLRGEAFLHRSRVPLDQAPLDTPTRKEWRERQGDLFDNAADEMLEAGDPDGCSPWSCRSGQPV
jgi:3'-phosphoadenosine 5'-phosphosulfate sulfotransferase (PAPS reductase)/FAD synthetase